MKGAKERCASSLLYLPAANLPRWRVGHRRRQKSNLSRTERLSGQGFGAALGVAGIAFFDFAGFRLPSLRRSRKREAL
jgi:hypothetical protein